MVFVAVPRGLLIGRSHKRTSVLHNWLNKSPSLLSIRLRLDKSTPVLLNIRPMLIFQRLIVLAWELRIILAWERRRHGVRVLLLSIENLQLVFIYLVLPVVAHWQRLRQDRLFVLVD